MSDLPPLLDGPPSMETEDAPPSESGAPTPTAAPKPPTRPALDPFGDDPFDLDDSLDEFDEEEDDDDPGLGSGFFSREGLMNPPQGDPADSGAPPPELAAGPPPVHTDAPPDLEASPTQFFVGPPKLDSAVHSDGPPQVHNDGPPQVHIDGPPQVHIDAPPPVHDDGPPQIHDDGPPPVHDDGPPPVHAHAPPIIDDHASALPDALPGGAPSSPALSLVGTTLLGRYLIRRLVGEGGMGSIYEGEHLGLGKPVAIKILRPEMAHDGELIERFMREARATARIRHPNVVDISDVDQVPQGSAFFVMELLEGQDLEQILCAQHRLSWPRTRHLALQIASGLQAAHDMGVVHRDMKPANVYVVERSHELEFVKVLDFGIAKMERESALTQAGVVFGTAAYMAPEQARGESVDTRADVYALGCMLFEMLTGRVPFDAPQPVRVLNLHIQAPRPRVCEFAPDVDIPAAAEDLILRMMAIDPAQRCADMREVERCLAAIVDGTGDTGTTSEFQALDSGGYQADASGEYQTNVVSGEYQTDTNGEYQANLSGEYQANLSGEYQANASGEYQANLSGEYQADASGEHQADASAERRPNASAEYLADALGGYEADTSDDIHSGAISGYQANTGPADPRSVAVLQFDGPPPLTEPEPEPVPLESELRNIEDTGSTMIIDGMGGEELIRMLKAARGPTREDDLDPDLLIALAFLYVGFAHSTDDQLTGDEMRVLVDKIRGWAPGRPLEHIGSLMQGTVTNYLRLPKPAQLERTRNCTDQLSYALPEAQRPRVLDEMRVIAAADGVILEAEQAFIHATAERMGLRRDPRLSACAFIYLTLAQIDASFGPGGIQVALPEMRVLAEQLQQWVPEADLQDTGAVLREAVTAHRAMPNTEARLEHARACADQLRAATDAATLKRVLADLWRIAGVDADISHNERTFIMEMVQRFGTAS